MVGRIARFALVLLLVLGVALGAFVVALEHPSTKGATRCWLQETVYGQAWEEAPADTPVVDAVRVTEVVRDLCDAADDPAILVSEVGAFVLGTNKQRSLNIYDLEGALVARADDLGAPNNVDLRILGGRAIAAASEKDGAEIEVFTIDQATGEPTLVDGAPFPARAEDELYGLCLHRSGEELFVFTTDKSGLIVQYRLSAAAEGPGFVASEVRSLRVETQPEGCVVDDASGALYVGEEDVGIWRFDARPGASAAGELIARTGPEGPLTADVEGLAIYEGESAEEGYLIASSQGDNTYAVFARTAPHAFLGRFQVRFEGEIIGDTDGLDVTSRALGKRFPKGLLVVQDGFVRTGGREGTQNLTGERRQQRFAYVSWADVEAALGLGSEPIATAPD